MTENYLLQLPLEILYIVLDLLDLASIYQLGAACRGLHRIIHQVGEFITLRFPIAERRSLACHSEKYFFSFISVG